MLDIKRYVIKLFSSYTGHLLFLASSSRYVYVLLTFTAPVFMYWSQRQVGRGRHQLHDYRRQATGVATGRLP